MPNVAESSIVTPPPLTVLSDEERMFQDAVRRFARERIGPYVREMDAAAIFRKDLLREMFELGLMGIEIPEEYGGQGGSFFQAVLAVEALAAVDPLGGRYRGCAEHDCQQRDHSLGRRGPKAPLSAEAGNRDGGFLRIVGGRLRIGRIRIVHSRY